MTKSMFFTMAALLLTVGCWPWWTLRRPETSFVVRNTEAQPIPGAKILVVVAAMPHAVFQGSTTIETDQEGLARVDTERGWELITPFIIHGIPAYFVIWCAEAVGYSAATERLWSENRARVEIRLHKDGTAATCAEAMKRWPLLRPTGSQPH